MKAIIFLVGVDKCLIPKVIVVHDIFLSIDTPVKETTVENSPWRTFIPGDVIKVIVSGFKNIAKRGEKRDVFESWKQHKEHRLFWE